VNIWITGTTRGLGAALASRYRERGDTVTELNRPNCRIDEIESVKRCVGNAVGIPDVLVNNAAVATLKYGIFLNPDDAEEMVQTNILGTWYVTREVTRLMVKAKHGTIVNIGSIHARTTPPGTTIYAATKAAVEAMTGAFSKELAPFGITVNCIGLSPFESDMLRASGTPDAIEEAIAAQPLPRLAVVEDVAGLIDFFHENRMVTGQMVYLGGI
jgi:3-oxoacyl-[acyl-carrier protein] reductase